MTSSGLIRRNWRLKISAVAVTVLLWATIRVSAVSRQDLPEVQVRVENDDPDWVPVGLPSPATVQLGLTGPARDLFRVAVDRPVIVVPMDNVLSEDTIIIIRPEWVRNAGRPGVSIEDITPSTIRVQFERNEGAAIPVTRQFVGSLPDSLSFLSAPQINPLFTNVRGPASRVDALETINTEGFDLGTVSGSGRFLVPLDTAGIGLRVNPAAVTLTLSLGPTVERQLGLMPIVLPPQSPNGLEVVEDSASVGLRGADAVLTAGPHDAVYVEVLVDPLAREMEPGEEMYLPLVVRRLPDWTRGVVSPDSVLVRRSGAS